jgi:probable rRNA maturation factor
MAKIIINNTTSFSPDTKKFSSIAIKLLLEESINKNAEISVTLTGKKDIKEINRIYRNVDESTDVISLPLFADKQDIKEFSGKMILLGEIYLCPEKIEEDAREQNLEFDSYFWEVYTHGLLHLVGYEHKTDEQFNNMINLQKKYAKNTC